jgi:hypothetical protein
MLQNSISAENFFDDGGHPQILNKLTTKKYNLFLIYLRSADNSLGFRGVLYSDSSFANLKSTKLGLICKFRLNRFCKIGPMPTITQTRKYTRHQINTNFHGWDVFNKFKGRGRISPGYKSLNSRFLAQALHRSVCTINESLSCDTVRHS